MDKRDFLTKASLGAGSVFEDKKSLETFNKSDYHQQLIANFIKPVLEEILVLDYEIK